VPFDTVILMPGQDGIEIVLPRDLDERAGGIERRWL
jgi:hypothetical protein